jgi:hypothetical protein
MLREYSRTITGGNTMYNSQYVLNVIEDEEVFPYPYSNLQHAQEHFDWEQVTCILLEYKNGKYHVIKVK